MIVRIILLFLLFKYHREIYKFLLSHNVLSLTGLGKKVSEGMTQAQKYMSTHPLKKKMLELKNLDKSTYREVKKRLLNIDMLYTNASENNDESLRNTYQSIKDEKKYIKNRISSLVVKIGLWKGQGEMIEIIEKHIDDIIKNILDMRDRRGINTDWFEGIWYEPVIPYDSNINTNYDFYTQ